MISRDKKIILLSAPLGLLLGAFSFPGEPTSWKFTGVLVTTTVLGVIFNRMVIAENEKSAKAICSTLIFFAGYAVLPRILGLSSNIGGWNRETAVWTGQFVSTVFLSLAATLIAVDFIKCALSKADHPTEQPSSG